MILVAFLALLAAAAAALGRLIVGPTLADRVIALDLLLITLMTGIAVDAGNRSDPSNLKLLVVIAIIGFTATVSATAFIEREAERAASAVDSSRNPEPSHRRSVDTTPEASSSESSEVER